MRPGSTRRIIPDSDSEPEPNNLPPASPKHNATPTSDAASHTPAEDGPSEASESESEPRPKKKAGRKPKPKLPIALPAAEEDDHAKSKRISWGAYPKQVTFLEKALDDILLADKQKQRALKKKAKKDFYKKWPTLGAYTRSEVEKGINNWFKNHIQFPQLRKNKPTATSEEHYATDKDDGPLSAASAHPAPAAPSLSASDPTSIALAPLLKSIRRCARGPSGAALGGDIGALKLAVRELYNGLPDAEKALWEEKAAQEKDKQSQDDTQCFRNQDDFPLLIATLLGSFIGFESQQVGSAVIYFRIAMRNETGAIQHDQYTVGLPEDADAFDIFAGGPKQDEIDRWASYVDAVLPPNPLRRDERLTYEPDGLPKLPPYNDEWTVAQVRSALEAWFQAMWHYGLEYGVDLPNGLDWSNFPNTVAPHVPPEWAARVPSKPSDRPFHHLVTLYHDLFMAQDMPNAFRWSSSAPLNTAETLTANRAPPQTPSKTTYTTYTTPARPSVHTRHQSRTASTSSARPLPRLVFPVVDTLTDEDDAIAPRSSPHPAVDHDDHDDGSAVVETASQVASDAGVAVQTDLDPDVGMELAPRPTPVALSSTDVTADKGTSEHVGAGMGREDLMREGNDSAMGEVAANVSVVESHGTLSGDGNEQLDDAHVHPNASGGHNARDTGTVTHRSKRK
ncbi:hypothetical protein LXA43DRAFT_1102654 [Ganoderma leucocontextum]|nr:hypothetical protein LXA43DRAFT_1102654 [Ganoderma leucocontextum]